MHYLYMLHFPSGKKYIGITNKLKKRFQGHVAATRAGSTLPVHQAFSLYGERSVTMEVIGESYTRDKIAWMEIDAIALHRTLAPYGYNISVGGDRGGMDSPEVRARVSASLKGKYSEKQKASRTCPLFKERLSLSLEAFWAIPGNKDAASKKQKGRKFTTEHCAAISASKSGDNFTPEYAAFMAWLRSRKNPNVSESTRAKLSKALKGKPRSESCKEKMRETLSLPGMREKRRAAALLWRAKKAASSTSVTLIG